MSTSIGIVNAVVVGAGVFALVGRSDAPDLVTTTAAVGCSVVVALAEATFQVARYRAVSRTASAAP